MIVTCPRFIMLILSSPILTGTQWRSFIGLFSHLALLSWTLMLVVVDGRCVSWGYCLWLNAFVLHSIENHFHLTRSIVPSKAITTYGGMSRTIEADIFLSWVEINSLILWNLLIENVRYANEIQSLITFVNFFSMVCPWLSSC